MKELNLKSIRKISARVLKVGISKVWIDEAQTAKVKEAITKEDIKGLIKGRVIRKKRDAFQSRGRARLLQAQKRKGRKKGFGKRKGTQKTRMRKKQSWVKRVRALRKKLRELKKQGIVEKGSFKRFYKLIKGNYFKGKKQLEEAARAGSSERKAE